MMNSYQLEAQEFKAQDDTLSDCIFTISDCRDAAMTAFNGFQLIQYESHTCARVSISTVKTYFLSSFLYNQI